MNLILEDLSKQPQKAHGLLYNLCLAISEVPRDNSEKYEIPGEVEQNILKNLQLRNTEQYFAVAVNKFKWECPSE